LVFSAATGLLAGTVIGFATAPDRIGVPPLLGAIGLLLGLGVAASTRISVPRGRPAVPRSRLSAAAAPSTRSEIEVAAPGEPVEADDEWMVPPGWYPDPRGIQPTRYWDGAAWTDEIAEAPTS
jgi:hypothetical protein